MQESGSIWVTIAVVVAIVALVNFAVLLIYRWSASRLMRRQLRREQAKDAPITGVLAQEIDDLRERVSSLRDEMEQLKSLKPAVSPYNQALHMAKQGFSATEVAASCGISRSEAEFIIALCRKTKINGVE